MAAIVNSKVLPETIDNAVGALLKWKEVQSKTQTPQLLPQDEFLYLVLSLKKIPPKSRTNPHKIPLPHPLLHHDSAASELCLIIDDRPSSKLTSEIAKQKIKNDGVPVSKVIRLSKLKTDYKAFEAKRKLCDSYDLFFADKRVVTLLPKLLGKHFFKKRKLPLPVDLTHKGWKEQIERLCCSALLHMRNGTCSVVRVGRVSMEKDEIIENVGAAIDGVVEFLPKKWGGVRSMHLKLAESLPLPVYQALPDMKLKIQGIVSNNDDDDKALKVVKEPIVEKPGKKKKGSEKGRIHEVRYMDATTNTTMTEVDGDDEVGSEGESEDDIVRTELVSKKRKKGVSNVDIGSAGKKKKKGDLMKGEVDSKKESEKQVKRKAEKGEELKEKIDSESGKKGKKKGDNEMAIKVKRSKKGDVKEQIVIEQESGKKGKKNSDNETAIKVKEQIERESGKKGKKGDKETTIKGKRKAEKGEELKEKIDGESGKKGDNEMAIKAKRSKKDDVKEQIVIEQESGNKGKKNSDNETSIKVKEQIERESGKKGKKGDKETTIKGKRSKKSAV